MRATIVLAFLCLFLKPLAAKPSRVLQLAESDVGQVNTALGYSTILQFDSRPTSVVLGDQDGFKVEYVGNSLTIKPVSPGGKTNLFVFTDYDRFNFRVAVGASQFVDYVVQVKRKRSKEVHASDFGDPVPGIIEPEPTTGNMATIPMAGKSQCGGVELRAESLSYPKDRPWAVLAFSLSTLGGKSSSVDFRAEDLTLRLGSKIVPVETLYLEKLQIPGDASPIRGSLLFHLKSPKLASKLSLVFTPEILKKGVCHSIKVTLGTSKTRSKK